VSSPYPWYYNLRWIFDYVRPSLTNFDAIVPGPRRGEIAGGTASARVVFFGDLMCNQGDRVPEFSASVRAICSRADLVVGNCEAPILFDDLRPYARYYAHFAMASAYLERVLEAAAIAPSKAVLSIANNHIADQGAEGLRGSIERLDRMGAIAVGHKSRTIAKIEVGGLRIGLLAWSHWLNSGRRLDDRSGIWRTEDLATIDLAAERRTVDVLIGTPHWEYEFRHFPAKSTRALARSLLEGAFDLIVGHHPHVVQPVERIGERRLVAYSLGNLVGPSLRRVGWPVRLGALLEVELSKSGLVRYTVHPIAQRCEREHVLAVSSLEEADEEVRGRLSDRFALVCPAP
jgi:poly-gamma-glutamate synthesis protein (capsule biosynthesis protein)